jgi:hypothetical protein
MRDLRFVQVRLRNVEMENDVLKAKVAVLETVVAKNKSIDLTDDMESEDVADVKVKSESVSAGKRLYERSKTYYKLSDIDYERPPTGQLIGPVGAAVEDYLRSGSAGMAERIDSALLWYKKKNGKTWCGPSTNMTAKGVVLVPKRQVVDFDYRMVREFKYQKLNRMGYVVDTNSIGALDVDGVWHEFVSDFIGCREGEKYKHEIVTEERQYYSNVANIFLGNHPLTMNDRRYMLSTPITWQREMAMDALMDALMEEGKLRGYNIKVTTEPSIFSCW